MSTFFGVGDCVRVISTTSTGPAHTRAARENWRGTIDRVQECRGWQRLQVTFGHGVTLAFWTDEDVLEKIDVP